MADTKDVLICPACGERMTKVYVKNSDINVDICLDGCGGMLFDNRELEKCDENNENIDEILSAISDRSFKEVDTSKQRECSVCGATMMKMGAGFGNVQLDCCAFCGAKFLDNGELQKIRTGEKSSIDGHVMKLIDSAADRHLEEVNYGIKTASSSSPRRQFVEDIVKAFLFR